MGTKKRPEFSDQINLTLSHQDATTLLTALTHAMQGIRDKTELLRRPITKG